MDFNEIKLSLEQALAFARGETNGCVVRKVEVNRPSFFRPKYGFYIDKGSGKNRTPIIVKTVEDGAEYEFPALSSLWSEYDLPAAEIYKKKYGQFYITNNGWRISYRPSEMKRSPITFIGDLRSNNKERIAVYNSHTSCLVGWSSLEDMRFGGIDTDRYPKIKDGIVSMFTNSIWKNTPPDVLLIFKPDTVDTFNWKLSTDSVEELSGEVRSGLLYPELIQYLVAFTKSIPGKFNLKFPKEG